MHLMRDYNKQSYGLVMNSILKYIFYRNIAFHGIQVNLFSVKVCSEKSCKKTNVTVRSEGTEAENFDVNIYYDSTLIETLSIESLTLYAQACLNLSWNTSALTPGNYTIRASIPLLPNETETTDNTYIDGIVRSETTEIIENHDVAVIGVTLSHAVVNAGSLVSINVTVKNKGNQVETFNLSTYYNFTNLIRTLTVSSLLPNREQTLPVCLEYYWGCAWCLNSEGVGDPCAERNGFGRQ